MPRRCPRWSPGGLGSRLVSLSALPVLYAAMSGHFGEPRPRPKPIRRISEEEYNMNTALSPLLRLSAILLLLGQILYVLVTLLHTGGPANDHPVIFAAYAGSGSWAAVHIAQFACLALLIAGLLALSFALDTEAGPTAWVARLGAASAVVALALEGALQAVDGVANKQADLAWVG